MCLCGSSRKLVGSYTYKLKNTDSKMAYQLPCKSIFSFAGALPWSHELGKDKLLEIEYFISFSRILRHNVHFGHTGELCSLNPHHPGGSVGVPLFGKHCPNFAWVSTCGFYHNFRQRLHVGDLDGSGY